MTSGEHIDPIWVNTHTRIHNFSLLLPLVEHLAVQARPIPIGVSGCTQVQLRDTSPVHMGKHRSGLSRENSSPKHPNTRSLRSFRRTCSFLPFHQRELEAIKSKWKSAGQRRHPSTFINVNMMSFIMAPRGPRSARHRMIELSIIQRLRHESRSPTFPWSKPSSWGSAIPGGLSNLPDPFAMLKVDRFTESQIVEGRQTNAQVIA